MAKIKSLTAKKKKKKKINLFQHKKKLWLNLEK